MIGGDTMKCGEATKSARLSGKTALVTGASRGIGRATALRLAAEGSLVVVHHRSSPKEVDEVVKTIAKSGGAAFAIAADLRLPSNIDVLFAELDETLTLRTGSNGLDILVNNAGIGPRALMEYVPRMNLMQSYRSILRPRFVSSSERRRGCGAAAALSMSPPWLPRALFRARRVRGSEGWPEIANVVARPTLRAARYYGECSPSGGYRDQR